MPLLAQAIIGKNNIFIKTKINCNRSKCTTLPRADINLKLFIVAYFVTHVSLSINVREIHDIEKKSCEPVLHDITCIVSKISGMRIKCIENESINFVGKKWYRQNNEYFRHKLAMSRELWAIPALIRLIASFRKGKISVDENRNGSAYHFMKVYSLV